MPLEARRRVTLLWGLLVLSGCAGWLDRGPPLTAEPVELREVAFFPQRAYHCGPAALATVLADSGVDVHPDALASAVYVPERRGSLQVELVAAARRQGRLAVELGQSLQAIVAQLQAGRPVLVLQNLAVSFYPVWHYAVVVGYEPSPDRFILRSGETRRQLTGRGRFAATWQRAGNWGLVVLAPEDDPAGLRPQAYLKAAADLESTGAHQPALTAFRSAVSAWPDEPLGHLGEANNLYYLGRLEEAAGAYQRLLDTDPGHVVARHNLTMLLLELDRPCDAREVVAGAQSVSGPLMETARRSVADAAPRCDAG